MKVSLFPFLPVLLCMMGAMIMLLVVAARDVRESAIAPPPEMVIESAEAITPSLSHEALTMEEAEELGYKIQASSEDADWYAENLRQARQKAEEELAEYQARLAHAENATQKIRDELARLEQLARQLDADTQATPEEVEQLQRLLTQQQQRLAEAELELAELRKDAARREKSYAIVPARGADGTFRRPIYFECRDNRIIIQPEGVELIPSDFQALDEPANPFDTVLRIIRQYYIDTEQIARGSEPYPLLIVRPSGVEMYENAQMAMGKGNWVRDFGYQLVNEDWDILYPEPNEELRNRIIQHLEISRNRLNSYLMARRMATPMPGYGGDMSQQFRMDHRGNVVPAGNGLQPTDGRRQLGDGRRQTAEGSWETADGRRQTAEGSWETAEGGQQMAEASPQRVEGSWQTADGGVQSASPHAQQEAHARPPTAEGSPQHAGLPAPRVAEASAGPPGMASAEQQMMSRPPQNMQPRPQNWGLKGVTQFSTSLSRTVIIRCEAERLVLPRQAGLLAERAIPIAGSVSAAADQLVMAVWEFQESWGSAGANMHWRPILKVQVTPGGERRLQELKVHLRNSGLVIEEH